MRSLTIILAFLCSFAFGQNLVLNPSFEDTVSCPTSANQLSLAVGWSNPNPTGATPDYMHACGSVGVVGVPQNWGGQYPVDGEAYSGVFSYCSPGCWSYREYVQGQLTTPLVANQRYCVEFYVSLADTFQYATDGIGLYFSDTMISGAISPLPYYPQIDSYYNTVISDKIGWTKISGTYTAHGGEQYLIIGCFKDSASITTVKVIEDDSMVVGNSDDGYYYIDMVSVIPYNGSAWDNCEGTATFELWLPNIFSPNGDGANDELLVFGQGIDKLDLYVYNRWGEQLYEGHDPAIGWDGTQNGSPAPPGVYMYYAVATYANGETETKYGNVTLVR